MQEYINGQPTKKAKQTKDTAADYYKLGRTAAGLEQQREDIQQDIKLGFAQKIMLMEQEMQVKRLIGELQQQQQSAILALLAATKSSTTAMPGAVGPPDNGIPPLPGAIPPAGLAGGAPPLPQGLPPMPPDMMGGGPMPPDMMGGGPMPPGMMGGEEEEENFDPSYYPNLLG